MVSFMKKLPVKKTSIKRKLLCYNTIKVNKVSICSTVSNLKSENKRTYQRDKNTDLVSIKKRSCNFKFFSELLIPDRILSKNQQ